MPKSTTKPVRPHDPTPAELDERYKIEGLTFEQAVEKLLTTPREQPQGSVSE